MHHVEWIGPAAELRWGYRPAATITAWTLTTRPGGGTLTGTVATSSPLALQQPGLTFVANRREWPIVSMTLDGSALSAEVGPQKG